MKTVVLKISGHLFDHKRTLSCHQKDNGAFVTSVLEQIKVLINQDFRFGIVLGGGNFFRGAQQAQNFNIQRSTGDMVGMLATVMNGLMLYDLLSAMNIKTVLLNALHMPQLTETINQKTIDNANKNNTSCIIFVGGTGNPYFSTDTNAIIRALQLGATEIWKATNVDYIYNADPAQDTKSKPLATITHEAFLQQKLQIMDLTAITLAQEHKLPIRIFNLFKDQALVTAARDLHFGSTIISSSTS